MKPTNEERLQVVEAILQLGPQLDEAAELGDQKVLLAALLSSSRLMLTALAMLLVEKTSAPSDPQQLLLFQDVDADDQTPT
jgi:hypothetical protein